MAAPALKEASDLADDTGVTGPAHPILQDLAAAILGGLLLSGCGKGPGEPPDTAAARAAVEDFQRALLGGDTDALHHVLRRNARPMVPHLLERDLGGRRSLEILGVRPDGAAWRVAVRDPNHGGAESFILVCRENGAFRVDLLATARLQQKVEHIQLAEPVFRARRMTPEQKALAARYARRNGGTAQK